jgi:hypothetical protein
MKQAFRMPSSVLTPSGTDTNRGWSERGLWMMEKENGSVPLLTVIRTRPSGESVMPYGCGSTRICRPLGVSKRPLGMTVVPSG